MDVRTLALAVCVMAMTAVAQDAPPANLVTNGNFAEVRDNQPVGWTTTAAGHDITVDKEEHPANIAQCLKVEIRKSAEGQAGISQTVKNVPANTKLVLSGQMKGSDRRLGYLQVKLKKAGKELKREKTDWNTDDWKVAKIEFNTADADELTIECRFSQSEKAKDQKVRFADIKLAKAEPKAAP